MWTVHVASCSFRSLSPAGLLLPAVALPYINHREAASAAGFELREGSLLGVAGCRQGCWPRVLASVSEPTTGAAGRLGLQLYRHLVHLAAWGHRSAAATPHATRKEAADPGRACGDAAADVVGVVAHAATRCVSPPSLLFSCPRRPR